MVPSTPYPTNQQIHGLVDSFFYHQDKKECPLPSRFFPNHCKCSHFCIIFGGRTSFFPMNEQWRSYYRKLSVCQNFGYDFVACGVIRDNICCSKFKRTEHVNEMKQTPNSIVRITVSNLQSKIRVLPQINKYNQIGFLTYFIVIIFIKTSK